jgi:phage N-6-adenine-methyltransferase
VKTALSNFLKKQGEMMARHRKYIAHAKSKTEGRCHRHRSPARRQASYRRRRELSVHFSSSSCDWSTPPAPFAELDKEFAFDLDPCATPENAKCARYFTRQEDGLTQRWTGRVFLNPPYGRAIGEWLKKAWESIANGDAELVVCLVPARTDTAWWHRYCAQGQVRFLRGRLRFGGAESSAPFPSAVVVFRKTELFDK